MSFYQKKQRGKFQRQETYQEKILEMCTTNRNSVSEV